MTFGALRAEKTTALKQNKHILIWSFKHILIPIFQVT
ncbi:hypothetical protein CAEBREN_06121 [Caenorhabditis brenneri]|uniref:Uncharacterized protein n=1 Tax=Caenorhabditis brenneri TaxID=135651 RepID=G0MYR4_CAEBE|nr:hypothetical protein CAEBREN_06121 [Caenorhabditis brenneri]